MRIRSSGHPRRASHGMSCIRARHAAASPMPGWRTEPKRGRAYAGAVVEPAADVEGGGGVRRRRLVVAAPWVLGLVAVGAVQAVRAQWLDAAMFLGVSVALALDAAGAFDRMPRTGPVRRAHAARGAAGPWRPARVTAWVAMAAAAVVLVASPRHGILAGAVAFVLGVVAVVVA